MLNFDLINEYCSVPFSMMLRNASFSFAVSSSVVSGAGGQGMMLCFSIFLMSLLVLELWVLQLQENCQN